MIARMKRSSMPEEEATLEMAALISLTSVSESSASPHCAQDASMFGLLAANADSKSIHESWLGQPDAAEPSPENILYCQLPPEPPDDVELADGAGGAYDDCAGGACDDGAGASALLGPGGAPLGAPLGAGAALEGAGAPEFGGEL